jgi:anti-sigma B factor antagonist
MLSHELRDGIAIIRVEETRVDAARAPSFKSELTALIEAGYDQVVLDLGRVEFVDSSGLGAIVSCLKRIGPRGNLSVAGAGGAVAKLFTLTRMDKVFALHPDVDTAVAKMAA